MFIIWFHNLKIRLTKCSLFDYCLDRTRIQQRFVAKTNGRSWSLHTLLIEGLYFRNDFKKGANVFGFKIKYSTPFVDVASIFQVEVCAFVKEYTIQLEKKIHKIWHSNTIWLSGHHLSIWLLQGIIQDSRGIYKKVESFW